MSSIFRIARSVYAVVDPCGARMMVMKLPRSSTGTSVRGSRVRRKTVPASDSAKKTATTRRWRRNHPSSRS